MVMPLLLSLILVEDFRSLFLLITLCMEFRREYGMQEGNAAAIRLIQLCWRENNVVDPILYALVILIPATVSFLWMKKLVVAALNCMTACSMKEGS